MDELLKVLQDAGATLVGFADLSLVDEATRQGMPRAVAIGVALTPRVLAGIMQRPTEEYFDEYKRVNALLSDIANTGAEYLKAHRWQATPLLASGNQNAETWTAPFQHKTSARLAGLGWISKCALLINPTYGPAMRWNTILTDAPLPTACEALSDGCGNCTVCMDICPGKAPSGKSWQPGMAREDFWDARACLAGQKRITQEHGIAAPLCGLCVANCPHTVAYLKREGAI